MSLIAFLFLMKSITLLRRRRRLPHFSLSHAIIPRSCTSLALLTPTRSCLLFPPSLWMASLESLLSIFHLIILSSFSPSCSLGSNRSPRPKAQPLRCLYSGSFHCQHSPFFPGK